MMSQLNVAALGTSEDSCRQMKFALQVVAATAEIFIANLPLSTAASGELGRSGAGLILVEVSSDNPARGLEAMSLAHELLPKAKLVAVGRATDSVAVVGAMRAGACDFLEAPLDTLQLARLVSGGSTKNQRRGKVYAFVNAKGGSGATTLAVNLGLVLASLSRRVALVDLAVPGNAALHLDVQPSFTFDEACHNLHRLDGMLLEGMMTKDPSGLHLLAGASEPGDAVSAEQLASLLDVITGRYEFVVVDLSTRVDGLMRTMCEFSDEVLLVGQPDVPSMWNAQRLRRYISTNVNPDKIRLVLNRYRKTPGVSDTEFEKSSGCELVWTVPNQYVTVSKAITNGVPVVRQSSAELKQCFLQFARSLTGSPAEVQTMAEQGRNVKSLLERVASLRSLSTSGAKASA
jgi:pilus assembly protein CpaE